MSFDVSPLDEIAEVVDSLHKTPSYVEHGRPMVRVTDVKYGELDLSKTLRVDDATFKEFSRRYTPSAGDIIITRVGTYGVFGKVVNPSFCLGQNTAAIIPKSISADYLYAVLNSDFVRSQIEAGVVGSTQKTLSLKAIKALKIPRMGASYEAEVASFSSALDDRITLLRETNATLEAIAQALFKSWFVDFDPVRAKIEGRTPEGMDEATAALFPDGFETSELGDVPRGWRVECVAQWLSVLETGRRPKGGVSGISDGIPSIGAESIVRIGQFDFSKLKHVPKDFFAAMKSGRLTSRDVLLYKDGGKPGVFLPRVSMFGDGFPFDVCGINEHVFRIRLKEPFGQTFLYFWLWSDAVMHELKHRGGKAAIPGINQADVKELRITVPSSSILQRFEDICDPVVGQILNNAKRIQKLASLRDVLLPRLITGQLSLPEAQAAT